MDSPASSWSGSPPRPAVTPRWPESCCACWRRSRIPWLWSARSPRCGTLRRFAGRHVRLRGGRAGVPALHGQLVAAGERAADSHLDVAYLGVFPTAVASPPGHTRCRNICWRDRRDRLPGPGPDRADVVGHPGPGPLAGAAQRHALPGQRRRALPGRLSISAEVRLTPRPEASVSVRLRGHCSGQVSPAGSARSCRQSGFSARNCGACSFPAAARSPSLASHPAKCRRACSSASSQPGAPLSCPAAWPAGPTEAHAFVTRSSNSSRRPCAAGRRRASCRAG